MIHHECIRFGPGKCTAHDEMAGRILVERKDSPLAFGHVPREARSGHQIGEGANLFEDRHTFPLVSQSTGKDCNQPHIGVRRTKHIEHPLDRPPVALIGRRR